MDRNPGPACSGILARHGPEYAAYFGVSIGVPAWATVVAVFVVFFFVNGSLAYVGRTRQLKREGQTPPAYASYLFQTQKLGQPITIPAPVRVALGLVVVFGAALFVLSGGIFILAAEHSGQVVGGSLFLTLGGAFAYVGHRVIRMNRPNRRLFGADREAALPNNPMQPTPSNGSAERPR